MKKFILIVLVLLSIYPIYIFTGLYIQPERDGPRVLSSYVPTFKTVDMKGIEGAITDRNMLEKDEYGRVLYAFAEYTSYGYKENDVVVAIMQTVDRKHVYFYEDVFFTIVSDVEEFSSIDVNSKNIQDLKAANDWGKELNTSKMSKRKLSITYDLVANIPRPDNARNIYSSHLYPMLADFEEKYGLEGAKALVYDCDKENMLFWVYHYDGEIYKNYIALVTSDKKIIYMEVTDLYTYQSDLADFKKANGWNYG